MEEPNVKIKKLSDEEIEVRIPKFHKVLLYHATNGLDVMKESTHGRMIGETIKVPENSPEVIVTIRPKVGKQRRYSLGEIH